MQNRPFYCWLCCTTTTAAAWVCSLVDTLTGEPIATPPTQRLAPLVPTGSPPGTPATAWCGGIGMGEATVSNLTALEDSGNLPAGLLYVLCDQTNADRYEIIKTNHPAGQAFIGLQWVGESMTQALALIGLERAKNVESNTP